MRHSRRSRQNDFKETKNGLIIILKAVKMIAFDTLVAILVILKDIYREGYKKGRLKDYLQDVFEKASK